MGAVRRLRSEALQDTSFRAVLARGAADALEEEEAREEDDGEEEDGEEEDGEED